MWFILSVVWVIHIMFFVHIQFSPDSSQNQNTYSPTLCVAYWAEYVLPVNPGCDAWFSSGGSNIYEFHNMLCLCPRLVCGVDWGLFFYTLPQISHLFKGEVWSAAEECWMERTFSGFSLPAPSSKVNNRSQIKYSCRFERRKDGYTFSVVDPKQFSHLHAFIHFYVHVLYV